MAKKQLNLTIGENTVKGLKQEAEKLEMSVSAFVTMLYKNYEREQMAFEMSKYKEIFTDMQKLMKSELERQEKELCQK